MTNDVGAREPFVDEALNEKEKALQLVTEMPGIEKTDIQVNVYDSTGTELAVCKHCSVFSPIEQTHNFNLNLFSSSTLNCEYII